MKHFTDISCLSQQKFRGLLQLARNLQDEWVREGRNEPVLDGRSLAMVFMKASLRTRVSFEVGMRHLGGGALYLSPAEVGLGERETAADVARVLSGMADGIMARVFEHEAIDDLARHATVPVINGLSDRSHPCQALADIYTIEQIAGACHGLTIAFVGDGDNNTARSLIEAAGLANMEIRVIAPKGYQPRPEEWDTACEPDLVTDSLDAVEGVDVLYTDVWTSMGQEAESAQRTADLHDYQVNTGLLDRTGNPDVIVMHCLPAHRNEEITDSVMDGRHSQVFQQAHNRLHAQKALLAHLLGRVPLPD
ncbi:MAG: ornithine carbamoyltransferase [Caldilineaceae bacterium SB0662_bin_9]|uniref:Ornithine carbamoyltransferase n=1 Tax=Caldilineaceae bacterium SB0662_bin_9 TaxID=2605258 RepID=A0A6B1DZE3_9CHLR|nr:ornithine carbamoyltransferase [Caldilineaceae bacterium]MYD92075.1 ornithine carbamoyltransferase [Caldilineaceae bacterium SB0662_bin_9]